MYNEALTAKVLKLEEDLLREKAHSKLVTETLELKIEESEKELKCQKMDNDKLSKNLELKDDTIKSQNLKVFDLKKEKVD